MLRIWSFLQRRGQTCLVVLRERTRGIRNELLRRKPTLDPRKPITNQHLGKLLYAISHCLLVFSICSRRRHRAVQGRSRKRAVTHANAKMDAELWAKCELVAKEDGNEMWILSAD